MDALDDPAAFVAADDLGIPEGGNTMTHCDRVLHLLADGQPHSHHELYALHVIAHSRVSDLRARGHLIEQWRQGDLYFYRLLDGGRPDAPPPAAPALQDDEQLVLA